MLGFGLFIASILLRVVGIRVTGVRVTGLGLITVALVLRTVEQLKSGTAYARGKLYTRDQQPEAYWGIVLTFTVAIAIFLWLLTALLRGRIAGA